MKRRRISVNEVKKFIRAVAALEAIADYLTKEEIIKRFKEIYSTTGEIYCPIFEEDLWSSNKNYKKQLKESYTKAALDMAEEEYDYYNYKNELESIADNYNIDKELLEVY